jgi:hypothetical protein
MLDRLSAQRLNRGFEHGREHLARRSRGRLVGKDVRILLPIDVGGAVREYILSFTTNRESVDA